MSHTTQTEAARFWASIGRQPLYSFCELVHGRLEEYHQISAVEVRSQPHPEFLVREHHTLAPFTDLLQIALIARLPNGNSEQVLVLLDAIKKTFIVSPVRWTYQPSDKHVYEGELQQSFKFALSSNRENHEGRRNFVRACRVLAMLERDAANPLAPIASSHLRPAIMALI